MEFWVVSDLNEAELKQFVDEISAMSAPHQN